MKPLSAASTIIRVQFSDGTIGEGYRPAIEELAEKHGQTFTVLRERMLFGGQEVAEAWSEEQMRQDEGEGEYEHMMREQDGEQG